MKTQAFVVNEVKGPFILTDIELGECGSNEVLVKIVASGICHTDISCQMGDLPSSFPSINGHEGSGIVISIGQKVTRVVEGDSVLLSFASCQNCHNCTREPARPAGCGEFFKRNFGRFRDERLGNEPVAVDLSSGSKISGDLFGQSSFARHAVVSESSVINVPPTTNLIAMSPLGCGLQTGAGTIFNVFKPPPSSSLVIFGLGAVGVGALFAASYSKLSIIIVVDLFPGRLEFALKEGGATHALNGKDGYIVEQIKKITGGRGVEYGIEATGRLECLKSVYDSVGTYGKIASLGDPGLNIAPPFDIHNHIGSQKQWIGVCIGDANPPEFIPFLIKLFEAGKFPIDKISKTFKVEEFEEALAAMISGSVIKPIIIF